MKETSIGLRCGSNEFYLLFFFFFLANTVLQNSYGCFSEDDDDGEDQVEIELLEYGQAKISSKSSRGDESNEEFDKDKQADVFNEEKQHREIDSSLEKPSQISCDNTEKDDNKHHETVTKELSNNFNTFIEDSESQNEEDAESDNQKISNESVESEFKNNTDKIFIEDAEKSDEPEWSTPADKMSVTKQLADLAQVLKNTPEARAKGQLNVVESSTGETDDAEGDRVKKSDTSFEENDFNGFVFWREPIPDIEIDLNLEMKSKESDPSATELLSDRLLKIIQKHPTVPSTSTSNNSNERKKIKKKRFPNSKADAFGKISFERLNKSYEESQALFVAFLQQCEASKRFVGKITLSILYILYETLQ